MNPATQCHAPRKSEWTLPDAGVVEISVKVTITGGVA